MNERIVAHGIIFSYLGCIGMVLLEIRGRPRMS
jgi:hypothetical protein